MEDSRFRSSLLSVMMENFPSIAARSEAWLLFAALADRTCNCIPADDGSPLLQPITDCLIGDTDSSWNILHALSTHAFRPLRQIFERQSRSALANESVANLLLSASLVLRILLRLLGMSCSRFSVFSSLLLQQQQQLNETRLQALLGDLQALDVHLNRIASMGDVAIYHETTMTAVTLVLVEENIQQLQHFTGKTD